MLSTFSIRLTTAPSAIPNSTGMQALALIKSTTPDSPDIPVTIKAFGNSATFLGEQSIGHEGTAQGQLTIVKTDKGYDPVFTVSSFPTSFNSIMIIGRLGGDPDCKYFESGSVVAKFSLAVTTGKEETSWFNCECWSKTAELAINHLKKGAQIGVVGDIKIETWVDKQTGETRSKIVVKVGRIIFADSKKDREQADDTQQQNTQGKQQVQAVAKQEVLYDDIPF